MTQAAAIPLGLTMVSAAQAGFGPVLRDLAGQARSHALTILAHGPHALVCGSSSASSVNAARALQLHAFNVLHPLGPFAPARLQGPQISPTAHTTLIACLRACADQLPALAFKAAAACQFDVTLTPKALPFSARRAVNQVGLDRAIDRAASMISLASDTIVEHPNSMPLRRMLSVMSTTATHDRFEATLRAIRAVPSTPVRLKITGPLPPVAFCGWTIDPSTARFNFAPPAAVEPMRSERRAA